MVKVLLEAKADVYRKDRHGRTALDRAILEGNHKVVQILSVVRDTQKQEGESSWDPTG